jgi:hypothetical protein
MPAHQSTPDLDWLAFRYVAGELADVEAADFEQRLSVDQPAREAVAAAVDLSQCVIAAGRQSTATNPHPALSQRESDYARSVERPRSPYSLRAAGWLAAGVAAMLLVMAMVESVRIERTADPPLVRDSAASSREWSLAARWSDIRERAAEVWDEPAPWRDSNGVAARHDTSGDESTDELLSPDWLLAALVADDMDDINDTDTPRVIQE